MRGRLPKPTSVCTWTASVVRRQGNVARVGKQASIAIAAQEQVWQAAPWDATAVALQDTLPRCLLFLLLSQSKRVLRNGILHCEALCSCKCSFGMSKNGVCMRKHARNIMWLQSIQSGFRLPGQVLGR